MIKLLRTKYTHRYTHTLLQVKHKIGIKLMDCVNANFLTVLLYWSCAICYQWEQLGKGYMDYLSIISYNYKWIYYTHTHKTHRFLFLTTRISDSVNLVWVLKICISNNFPVAAVETGWRHSLEITLLLIPIYHSKSQIP